MIGHLMTCSLYGCHAEATHVCVCKLCLPPKQPASPKQWGSCDQHRNPENKLRHKNMIGGDPVWWPLAKESA